MAGSHIDRAGKVTVTNADGEVVNRYDANNKLIRKPARKLAPVPKHAFVRPEQVDGSHKDRKCVECGHRDDNSVHQ